MLRLVFTLLLIAAPVAAQNVRTTETESGIPVHFIPVPDAPTQTMSVVWSHPMASRLDAETGAMALGVLLASGSDAMRPVDMQIFREETGARAFVRTSPGAVILTISASPADMPALARMVNAAITQFPYDGPRWLARWRLLAAQQIRSAQLDLDAGINAVLAHLEYGDIEGHDLARDVATVPDDDLMGLIRYQSRQRPAMVVVAGPMLDKTLRRSIDAVTANLPEPGPALQRPVPHVPIKPQRILVVDETLVEPEMMLVAQTGGRGDRVRVGLDMLRRVMGAGLASRLSLAIRRELRASYDVSADSLDVPAGNQLFTIRGAIKPELLNQAIARAVEVYDDVRRNGITVAEGRAAQIQMFNGYRATETNDSGAMVQRLTDALTGAIKTGDQPLSDIARGLQPKDLRQVFALLPAPEDLLIVVQSPDANALPGACVVHRIAMIEDCL